MTYTVQISNRARRALRKLAHDAIADIDRCIRILARNPRPDGCQKLVNLDAYRVRAGDFRIVYEIHDDILVVIVIRVGHRRDVYRGL